MNFSLFHFELWNDIRRTVSQNNELRGHKERIEEIYDNLANTISHDKSLLEFERRFCHGKLGDCFQLPDYDNPTPEKKTDAILTGDNRNKLGILKLGDKNYKLQFKFRNPTTYFSVGIRKNDVEEYERNNIALIIAIPKPTDPSYYNKQKSVNNRERLFFLWIPNHPKWNNYQYDDVPPFIYFPLQQLRDILDFELLEKDQSILNDFNNGGSL